MLRSNSNTEQGEDRELALNLVKGSLPKRKLPATEGEPAPSQEEIDELFEDRITPETDLPPMMPLFEMFDVPCFYRGELVADCGKAKSGKTYFLSILMAAALKPDCPPPAERQVLSLERTCEAPLKVLWVDTEQSQQSTQEIQKERILPLAGIQALDDATFYSFNLRGHGYEKRKRLVDVAIRTIKPDIAIIDGIKDLMTDINDAAQATVIMEKLMKLAKDTNCCIVCVLHLNKSEQDRNMRGSIGTELTNKAFEVFQCEIIEESGTFKVTQTYSRKQKMKHKLYYRISEEGLPTTCSGFQEQPRDDLGRWTKKDSEALSTDRDTLIRLFTDAMEGRRQRPFNELMAVAFKKCGFTDRKVYYATVEEAVRQGIIQKLTHPEKNETWVELSDQVLPF